MGKYVKITLAVVVFLMLYFTIQSQYDYDGYILNDWTLTGDGIDRTVDFPFKETIRDDGLYTYEKFIVGTGFDTLVIPQMMAYAMNVYVDDELVYQSGSFDEPTANIWNMTHVVPLYKATLFSSYTLKIETYNYHDIGGSGEIYLANYVDVYSHVGVQNFLNSRIVYFFMGGYAAIGLLLIIVSRKSYFHNKENDYRLFAYFGIASFSYSIFMVDSLTRLSTGSPASLLWTRKISYAALYIGTYFLVIGMRRYVYGKKTPMFVLAIYMSLVMVMFILPGFSHVYLAANIIAPFLMISIFYLAYLAIRYKSSSLAFSGVLCTLTATQSVLLDLNLIEGAYLFQYGLFFFILSISYVIAYKYEDIEESQLALSLEVMIDPLTQAYNRAYLQKLEMDENELAIFVDMDKFKNFNDTYGHDQGDELLKYLVQLFDESFGDNHICIRYGGDEFVVILNNIIEEEVPLIIQTMRHKLGDRYNGADFSYGFLKYDGNLTDTLIQADHKMYSMKKKRYSK